MTNKSLQYKKLLIGAMEQCHGIVSDACKSVGVSRVTYYKYYNEDLVFKEAIDETECAVLDYVEGELFNKIKLGDTACIIFYLKTKGKKRGYIERNEFDLSGIPKEVNINVISGNSAEKLKKFLDG